MDMEFLQGVINQNTERFQGQNHGLGQPAPQGTYMTPGAYRRARQGMIAALFLPIMWRIGRNWYERTGDGGIALRKALLIVWYWKAWFFACFAWFVLEMTNAMWGLNVGQWHTYCRLVWTIGFFPLFVVYTRLVDMSLFRQRLVYRVVHPVDKVLHWFPWPVLLSMVMIPLFYAVSISVPSHNETPGFSDDHDVPVPGIYDPSTGEVYTNVAPGVETGIVLPQ